MPATEAASRRSFLAGLISLAAGGRIERGFPTPPEVLDYFRDKKLTPRFSWLDVWGEEHAHAFTVAGVLEERTLADFRAGIDQALANGTGFDSFKAEMQRRLKPIGWWGARSVADPESGKVKTVDFTRPRRLQTTFWSNVRSARAAGQWDRIQRTKRALPFILYVRTTAGDPRPEHLRWAGIILPVDHPFWRTHFPPNGWGCKCAVRQISAAQAARMLGRAPEDGGVIYRDAPPAERMHTFINKRTGVRTQVPDGIDPGWQTNPGVGRSKTLARILQEQLDDTPAELARRRLEKYRADDGFASFVDTALSLGAQRASINAALTKAKLDTSQVDVVAPWARAPVPLATVEAGLAREIGVKLPTVTITDAALAHNPGHPYPASVWGLVQTALDGGDIWRRRSDGRLLAMIDVDIANNNLGANTNLYPAITYAVTLGDPLTVYITDMQMELGPGPSSYVPTEASAATRATDNLSMPLPVVPANGFTIAFRAHMPRYGNVGDANTLFELLPAASTASRVGIDNFGSTGQVWMHFPGGVGTYRLATGVALGSEFYGAFSWSPARGWRGTSLGGAVVNVTIQPGPVADLARMTVGSRAGAAPWGSTIKRLDFWPHGDFSDDAMRGLLAA